MREQGKNQKFAKKDYLVLARKSCEICQKSRVSRIFRVENHAKSRRND